MFNEILRVRPQLDRGALQRMDRGLTRRFGAVARRFGSGLRRAITGGGIMAGAMLLINRLLNPLQEVENTLNRILGVSDELKTFAGQFSTTSGNLLKLTKLGESTGIDQTRMLEALGRFQIEVGQARLDPTRQTFVRGFEQETDIAESFFRYLQSLQQADPETRAVVLERLVGNRRVMEFSELLQTDFRQQLQALGLADRSGEELTRIIDRGGELQDFQELLKARRDVDMLVDGLSRIDEDAIRVMDQSERQRLERDISRLSDIEQLEKINASMIRMGQAFDEVIRLGFELKDVVVDGLRMIPGMARALNYIVESLRDLPKNLRALGRELNPFRRGE